MGISHIHHLNCGTLCPLSNKWTMGTGRAFERGRMVCHCLLLETDDGLVLVDTGVGLVDIEHRGYGRVSNLAMAPVLDPAETAIEQVKTLGYQPADVRHIVVTHLDLDHAGGLPDFPNAAVHVHTAEHAAATRRPGFHEKQRYLVRQLDHDPNWRIYDDFGEDWFGFSAVRPLEELQDEVLLVPTTGHSRGHSAVAVKDDDGWLLHCGDAYFHRWQMDGDNPRCPPGLRLFQNFVEYDGESRHKNTERLRELANRPEGGVTVFCSHDPVSWEQLARSQPES